MENAKRVEGAIQNGQAQIRYHGSPNRFFSQIRKQLLSTQGTSSRHSFDGRQHFWCFHQAAHAVGLVFLEHILGLAAPAIDAL